MGDKNSAVQFDLQVQRTFERVLASVSERLNGSSVSDLADSLEHSLGELVATLGYDRCTYSEFIAGDYLNVLVSVSAGGVAAVPRGRFEHRLPWFLRQLRAGTPVIMADLPRELPPEAVEEARHCQSTGLRSHLSLPVRSGGRVTSVLSFAAIRQMREWPPEMVSQLKMLGDVLGCALALARAEEEARGLRQRVWHADRLERVSVLAASIAHELNQPLAAILSNAQAGLKYLAREEAHPIAIQQILEAVVREDKRAAETIRTMRALVRKDDSERSLFDVAQTLGEIQRLLTGEFNSQAIRIDARLRAGSWVMADRVQIEQLVLNLLLNAAAATKDHGAKQQVIGLEVSRGAGDRVLIVVRDAGRGIQPQDLETVFEPFWTTSDGGLGLGLAICRSIVEAHDGRIWAESNEQGGATFRVELPAACEGGNPLEALLLDKGATVEPASDPKPELGLPESLPLICVVDDDPAVRSALLRLLWEEGWVAQAYASADEFLAHPPSDVACVILDVQMPGTSGLQLQQILLGMAPVPSIIFITGHADMAAGVEAMKLGATDFLEKPVDAKALIPAVTRSVERHRASQSEQRVRSEAKQRVASLSAREREILEHVVKGRLNKQIASDLFIAEQTVKQHRGRVMEKMGVRSVADLVRACETAGM